MNLEEFEKLKETAAAAQRNADRAAGATGELQKRLRREFGCKSVSAAKRLLKKMDTELAALEKSADARLRAFEAEND